MKVTIVDRRGRLLRVRIEGEEDLWTLKTILRPGDLVKARTFREVSMGGRGVKERKQIIVKVKVKQVEFQPFTGRLRIFGVITEGPEEYGLKGRHHSLAIGIGQEVEVERPGGWNPREVKKLRESGPRGRAIIVAVDYDEYGIALLAPHGYRILVEDYLNLPGKDDPSRDQELERNIVEVSKHIVKYAKDNSVGVVVIVGPGILKNMIAERVNSMAVNLRVVTDDASMGGRHGIEEALRRTRVFKALREYTIMEAELVLEEFMAMIAREPDKTAMGTREVYRVATLGAIDKVIVLDSMLHSIDDEVREIIDETLEEAEKYGGKVIIIPEDSPPGEKVKRLGGIIAVLRYNLPQEARKQSM